MILLRPHILGYKNRLASNIRVQGLWRGIFHFDTLVLVSIAIVMLGVYGGVSQLVEALRIRDGVDPSLVVRVASVTFFGFFFLLLFSSFLAALGTLFVSQDLPLILVTPVSQRRFFTAKFFETLASAGWMFFIFIIPLLFGVASGYRLPPSFVVEAFFIASTFAAVPTALGILGAILFVNFFPISRLGDLVIYSLVIAAAAFLLIEDFSVISQFFFRSDVVSFVGIAQTPLLPSTWAGLLVARSLAGMSATTPLYLPYLGFVLLICYTSYYVFKRLYSRGYATANEVRTKQRVRSLAVKLPALPVSRPVPVFAMIVKEARMFFRDSTQALQLALILLLTMLYLYNFRTLQSLAQLTPEAQLWWASLLNVANVFMGASVTSAIATRFVFPALSLEGRAYHLLRTTPLSVNEFVRAKFLAWFIPISILTLILLISGAFAIQATPMAIAVTVVAAISLSIGIVGLGIGSGAMYARFDWDSPAQVMSHFGSLVYMLLALGMILVTLLPCGYAFVAISLPHLFEGAGEATYQTSLFGSIFLVFFVNCIAAASALRAASVALTDLENE